MEELINMIATDSSAVDISDQIKDLLYNKTAGKIDNIRPTAASSLFGDLQQEEE
jgi:hypothetical protein